MAAESASDPHVVVIVVARNEEDRIDRCMTSLERQTFDRFSVVLVDDGSTDSTVARARTAFPEVRVISSPTRSISRNRDIGWRSTDGQFVAFLDADCEAPPRWLEALMGAVHETGAAAVGGGNAPPANESPHYAALGLMLDTRAGSRGSVQGKVPTKGGYVPHLPGLNVLFRRDALELVGGFDCEHFSRMGEDADMSLRLSDLGLKLWVTPAANVVHRQRSDLLSWARNMRGYGKGRSELLHRHPGTVSAIFLVPPAALCAFPFYLPVIAAYSAWVALRGRKPLLWPRIFALFAATHLAYGLGQIQGVFKRDNGSGTLSQRKRIAIFLEFESFERADPSSYAERVRNIEARLREDCPNCDVYLAVFDQRRFDIRAYPLNPDALAPMLANMAERQRPSAIRNRRGFHALSLFVVLSKFDSLVFRQASRGKSVPARHVPLICAARIFGTRCWIASEKSFELARVSFPFIFRR